MRRTRVIAVAKALGLQVRPPHSGFNGCVFGCPACGAELRHTKREDRRGSVGLHASGLGWRCFQCDASGDAIDFAAFKLRGSRYGDLAEHGRNDVRAWCCDFTQTAGGHQLQNFCSSNEPEPERVAPIYPPLDEVAALWSACVRVDEDPAVAAYLRGRALSPMRVADLDLARALPREADVPAWAQSWRLSGHRLIVPLYDSNATMRSALARAILVTDRKSLAPRGFQRAGLAMMCPFAQLLVREGAFPDWWPASSELRVIVAEGEIDYCTWATEFGDSAECAPATIGIAEGSWSPELAARIADRATVLIATHNDAPGNKYAERVIRTFEHRHVRLERWSAEDAP